MINVSYVCDICFEEIKPNALPGAVLQVMRVDIELEPKEVHLCMNCCRKLEINEIFPHTRKEDAYEQQAENIKGILELLKAQQMVKKQGEEETELPQTVVEAPIEGNPLTQAEDNDDE